MCFQVKSFLIKNVSFLYLVSLGGRGGAAFLPVFQSMLDFLQQHVSFLALFCTERRVCTDYREEKWLMNCKYTID